MRDLIKICGVRDPAALEAAIEAGADMVGFVSFGPSPRHLTPEAARDLAARAGGVQRVVLSVDAEDRLLDTMVEAVRPDALQLHGREPPARVEAVRTRYGVPVWKAIGVADADDLARARSYAGSADLLLFDAKPAALPGGNGVSFDWDLLAGFPTPFILSGGLTPANVAGAIAVARPLGVDVSSGVERAPGVKDVAAIAAFVRAARAAFGRLGARERAG